MHPHHKGFEICTTALQAECESENPPVCVLLTWTPIHLELFATLQVKSCRRNIIRTTPQHLQEPWLKRKWETSWKTKLRLPERRSSTHDLLRTWFLSQLLDPQGLLTEKTQPSGPQEGQHQLVLLQWSHTELGQEAGGELKQVRDLSVGIPWRKPPQGKDPWENRQTPPLGNASHSESGRTAGPWMVTHESRAGCSPDLYVRVLRMWVWKRPES